MDNKDKKNQTDFPPVVAVLGHVDHGKTTLLDEIRKTSIADREKGGITQAIGASQVEIEHDGAKKKITFIDTPGHAAFTKMRGRGAQAADIGILVVSLADGLKPQTEESIEIIKKSGIPYIVALTKSDLPDLIPEKVKKQLADAGVALEGYGGDVPYLEVSAKTSSNIKELLDLVLLVFDMHHASDYKEKISSSSPLEAVVIESRLDIRSGPKATVVVKNGTLNVREAVQVDGEVFKIRSLIDAFGKQAQSTTVGEAVEILGFSKAPTVGSIVSHESKADEAKENAKEPKAPLMKDYSYKRQKEHKGLSLVVVADTLGSLEAITAALPKDVKLISSKTGEVSEADVMLAKSTGSILISFNIKLKPNIQKLAMDEKILARNYEIIYELLDEVHDAQEGKLLSQMEKIYGQAKILAKFPFDKSFAFGVAVTEGRLAKGDRIRFMRGEEVVGETTIASLRVGKDQVSKVESGKEAGFVPATPLDIMVGDMILSHS